METRSKRQKRRRLISISSYIPPLRPEPDVPATFESLSDDPLTTVLEFVGKKSYRSFGGLNKQCKEVYLNTPGMTKETYVFGYGPLSAIRDKIERAIEDDDRALHDRVGKGVVLYNRGDVLEWALQQQNKYVLNGICNIAAEEGSMELLEEVFNNIDDEDDIEYIISDVDIHAAFGGKLNVLKWFLNNGLSINKKYCAWTAARGGKLHIILWLQEEKGLELDGYLYFHAIDGGGHLHVVKWLREQEVDWHDFTFRYAARKGNLDVLQYLHDEGCPWPEGHCVDEEDLKSEVIDWCRVNGYADRVDFESDSDDDY